MKAVADAVSVGLPRELAPGVVWLGECIVYSKGSSALHSCSASYLVSGDEASLLVDTGFPGHFEILARQLDEVLAGGAAPLRYLFCTHWEPPHVCGAGLLFERYPELISCGDPTDLDLMFPQISAEQQIDLPVGGRLDLGGREFVVLQGAFVDGSSTLWGYDTGTKTLFSADGLSYGHYHEVGQCSQTAEEAGPTLDIPGMTAMFSDAAFYWTRFTDVEPYVAGLEALIEDLDVQLICPAHGLPVTDLPASMPLVYEGMRMGARGELPIRMQHVAVGEAAP